MSSSLTEDYLRWLVPQVREEHMDPTYSDLIVLMFEMEFKEVESVPTDRNRVMDGLDLRTLFCQEREIPSEHIPQMRQSLGPCSFLEVLIGLSKRLAFAAGGDPRNWAWQLVENLELHKFPDPITRRKARDVQEILGACVQREYHPNGLGGFFPLAWADEDQREVELWYQMSAYIREQPEH